MKAMLIIGLIPLVVLEAQPFGHISFWFPVVLVGMLLQLTRCGQQIFVTTVSDMFPKKSVASVTGIGGNLIGEPMRKRNHC